MENDFLAWVREPETVFAFPSRLGEKASWYVGGARLSAPERA
jgi:hypothetical protein